MTEEPLVTAREVDAQLKIPSSTVHRMHRRGLLQGYYVGEKSRGVRFRLSEVLSALRQKPTPIKKEGKKAVKKPMVKKMTKATGNARD